MAAKKGPAPAPLDPRVAKKLLDLLSTDDDFRRLFQQDAHAGLVKAGYQAPVGTDASQAAALSGGKCMQLKASDTIAPKAQIIRDRAKLESSLSVPMAFAGATAFKAD